MADRPRINDLVDGRLPDFAFRGVITHIEPGSIVIPQPGQEGEPAKIDAPIAHVAVLGFASTLAVLLDTLTVVQHEAIPASVVVV